MVPKTKIEVRLTDDRRETLERLVRTGWHQSLKGERSATELSVI